MTLLALAMFAVSSTSRSTTVRPGQRVQGSGFRVQPQAFEVSDQKPEVGGQRSEVRSKQIVVKPRVVKSREKSLMAAATAALKPLAIGDREQSAMRAAQVVVAENSVVRACDAPVIDYRSHYDPTYDFMVYGIRDPASRSPSVETQSAIPSINLAGELDEIFHELASRTAKEPLPQAGAMKAQGIGVRWKSLAAAVGAWVKHHGSGEQPGAWQTGMSAPQVGWAEYAEFADRIARQNVASVEVAETSGSEKGVRSGDWLRHSAASGLHQLSWMLEVAAGELEGVNGTAVSVIGN
jgi:hypothetical protein